MDELIISILCSCHVLPTEENLLGLVEETAHKEMVQEPAYYQEQEANSEVYWTIHEYRRTEEDYG